MLPGSSSHIANNVLSPRYARQCLFFVVAFTISVKGEWTLRYCRLIQWRLRINISIVNVISFEKDIRVQICSNYYVPYYFHLLNIFLITFNTRITEYLLRSTCNRCIDCNNTFSSISSDIRYSIYVKIFIFRIVSNIEYFVKWENPLFWQVEQFYC